MVQGHRKSFTKRHFGHVGDVRARLGQRGKKKCSGLAITDGQTHWRTERRTDILYTIERPQSRLVINENWDQQCCTTIVKRKIRKLGYVRGVAKEKIAAREVNKKERFKMVKEKKECHWIVTWKEWTVRQEWVKRIFSEESQIVIVNNIVYMWRKVDKFNHQLVCPASRWRLSVMVSRCVCF